MAELEGLIRMLMPGLPTTVRRIEIYIRISIITRMREMAGSAIRFIGAIEWQRGRDGKEEVDG